MSEFRTIAVIGAGNMGSGIAQKYAAEGFDVCLVDLDQAAVERGISRIRTTLAEAVERKIYREDAAARIQARIRPVTDWSALAHVDLAIEAVFEDLAVKRSVFTKLAEVLPADAALATNTSSFFVRELAEGIQNPERVLGLHYFYHPAKNRLVEVIPGPCTPAALLQRVWALQEQIGKTPIASADAPGFIVNRFFVPWINEAARLLGEGSLDIATIEQAAIRAFKIGMGPFELMNVTGVPIGYHAAATLEAQLGPFYRPSDRIKAQMESGRPFDVQGEPDPSRFQAVEERLLGVAIHVAAALVSEGIGSIEDADIGARVGLRWARGPFELANRMGIQEAARLSRLVEERYDLGTPRILKERAAAGTPFTIRLVRSEIDRGIATLTLNRPDAMNALNPEVVRQLTERVEEAIADPSVRGLVLAGAGKAFVAGADIVFFVKNIEAGRLDDIRRFTEAGRALLHRIETCPKPVVVRLDGLALGGGLELALAADRIVATEKATVSFPETGIGIYPGLGGTQRTSRRVGVPLARWLVLGGPMVDMATAQKIGLVDHVVPHAGLASALRAAVDAGKAQRLGTAGRELPPGARGDAALERLHAFFTGATVDQLLAGSAATEGAADLEKLASRIRAKAPLALRMADDMITRGADLALDAGLDLEFARLEEVFRSADALEGLSSVLARRAPKFSGG